MMLSAFAPLSLMSLQGREPDSRRIYQAMIDGFGGTQSNEYDLTRGSRLEAFCFATALAIARTRLRLRQVRDQFMPLTAVEGLPLLEQELGLIPSPHATVPQRRAVAARRALLLTPASTTNVIAGLVAILGAAFMAYYVPAPTSAELWPAALGDAPMNLQRSTVARKIVQLTGPVSFVGTAVTVGWSIPVLRVGGTADLTSTPVAGDVFCFDVGKTGCMDRVTPTHVVASGATGTLTATFAKPHDAGALGFTHPIPYWMSDRRNATIVVTTAAAENADLRRQVNEYMRRTATGVSTWDIVEGSSTATTAFMLSEPSLSQRTLQAVTV